MGSCFVSCGIFIVGFFVVCESMSLLVMESLLFFCVLVIQFMGYSDSVFFYKFLLGLCVGTVFLLKSHIFVSCTALFGIYVVLMCLLEVIDLFRSLAESIEQSHVFVPSLWDSDVFDAKLSVFFRSFL